MRANPLVNAPDLPLQAQPRRVGLSGEIPVLDRFFPSCSLGLVEWYCRYRFGLRDVKKAWFANTVTYQRTFAHGWLDASGVDLAATLDVSSGTRERCRERIQSIYGVTFEEREFTSFGRLLAHASASLAQDRPVVSCYDMGLLQGEARSGGVFRPHMVAIVGLDENERRLDLVDQVKCRLRVDIGDYETSFNRYLEHELPFVVFEFQRTKATDRPLTGESVKQDLRCALENLFSLEPTQGLRALRAMQADVKEALERERKPFSIPGLWIFSHDRYCLGEALPHWEASELGTPALRAQLDAVLRRAFDLWFKFDMGIERSLHLGKPELMSTTVELLSPILLVEEELAETLRAIEGTL